MKTASTLLQLLTLSACLATQFHVAGDFHMPGVRRAMQTMAGASARNFVLEDFHAVETAVDL
jgi:hypothetical protein